MVQTDAVLYDLREVSKLEDIFNVCERLICHTDWNCGENADNCRPDLIKAVDDLREIRGLPPLKPTHRNKPAVEPAFGLLGLLKDDGDTQ